MARADGSRGTALRLALVHLRSGLVALVASVDSTPVLVVAAVAALLGDGAGRSGHLANHLVLALASLIVALNLRGGRRAAGRAALAAGALLLSNHGAYNVRHPQFPDDHVARLPMREPLSVEGTVGGDTAAGATAAQLRLRSERVRRGDHWQTTHGDVLIRVRATSQEWLAGQRVRLTLRLRRPRNFGNPHELDYEGYLASRGLYATAFLDNDAAIERLDPDLADPADWLTSWRRRVGRLIATHLAEPQAGVLAALVIGSDTPLPRELRDAFSRAGVSHVLSISGLHVGLVAATAYAVLRWLLARSRWLLLHTNLPKLAVAASLLPVLLYAGIAGDNVATHRAVIMIIVFLGAVLVDRQRHLLVGVAVAILIVLATGPGASLDISFQLSFVAVLGLSLGVARFQTWWKEREELYLLHLRQDGWPRLWRRLGLYLAVSTSALAATIPLTAFHFNQVSLVAPVANAVVVPLLGSLAVALGLLAAMILPFSESLAALAVLLAGPAVQAGIALTRLCAALPFAALRVVTPTPLELVLIYGGLLAVATLHGRARTRALLVWVAVVGLDGVYWYAERHWRSDVRVTFLSVGQGDSSVIELPGGAVMVIDAGSRFDGGFDVGERVVAPFLWSRKIATIDYLVMSHPDRDHYGGLTFLAANFAPRELWSTGATTPGESFARLMQTVEASGAQRLALRAGAERRLATTTLRVLSPTALGGSSDNDESLVLSMDFAGHRLLFTGDIQDAAEGRLLRETSHLRSTILKVPHHGSRTSSTASFVAAVQPSVAVISCGHENRFHFPHPEVMQRYAQAASTVLRTDLDGATTIRMSRSGAYVVSTYARAAPTALVSR